MDGLGTDILRFLVIVLGFVFYRNLFLQVL